MALDRRKAADLDRALGVSIHGVRYIGCSVSYILGVQVAHEPMARWILPYHFDPRAFCRGFAAVRPVSLSW